MPRNTSTYLLKLNERERKQLDQEAHRLGVSRADVIRRGLELVTESSSPSQTHTTVAQPR